MVDPFIGSGTTAVAAVNLGRRCVGFDISEKYVQLARRRVADAMASKSVATEVEAEPAPTMPRSRNAPEADRSPTPRVSRNGGESKPKGPGPHRVVSFDSEAEFAPDLATAT